MEGVCPKSFEYLELISQSESSNQTFYSSISIDGNTKEINQAVHLRITGNKIPVYFSMSIKDRNSLLQCQTCLETLYNEENFEQRSEDDPFFSTQVISPKYYAKIISDQTIQSFFTSSFHTPSISGIILRQNTFTSKYFCSQW